MEYVQERVATLHDYGDAHPVVPLDQTTVVIPLTEHDHTSPATTRVFSTLETVDPERVIVPLRAETGQLHDVVQWIRSFDLPVTVLWCTAPAIKSHLSEAGLNGTAGKGRDVWLALGLASDSEYVVVHDADARSYDESHVPRLVFPLANGYEFSKGYYARVENDHLYGRLFRLFYAPLVRALASATDEPFVSYLGAFRYALAGEFAMTGELARQVRAPRGWGLEVGTLNDAFDVAGFDGTAQVDLGVHRHEHRPVGGSGGLGEMCAEVGRTLFAVLEEQGVEPDYDELADRYRECASQLIDGYAADAAFNGLTYDRPSEHEQVERYAQAIEPPQSDDRLPAWRDAPVEPELFADLSADALAGLQKTIY